MLSKLLLITYYWPPSNNVGTYRWLYFTKHLADLGWQISVYHPSNAAYASTDEQLQNEIHPNIKSIAAPIVEPNQFLNQQANSGSAFQQPNSWFNKLLVNIRANYFVPDARKLWIKPSVKRLEKMIETEGITTIITNGPPHSMHLIGLALKQKYPHVRWVADFRDPWQEIDYFNDLPLSKKAKQKHEQLEQNVLKTADAITTVSPSWKRLFEQKGARNVLVYTNGYNEEDFQPINREEEVEQELIEGKPIILFRHLGSIDESRNPTAFWEFLKESKLPIQVELIGNCTPQVREQTNVLHCVKVLPPVAHHKVPQLMQQSDVLLLLNNTTGANKGRIPAKLFEYFGANRPILYFGPTDNDAADLIKDYEAGICLDYSATKQEIAAAIEQLQQYQPNSKNKEAFRRKKIANNYHYFLSELL